MNSRKPNACARRDWYTHTHRVDRARAFFNDNHICVVFSCSDSCTRRAALSWTQILQGLSFLHSMKTMHRDIKGGNILVERDGRVKLADFGMAKQLLDGMTCTRSFKGSPFWMAPESVRQQGSDLSGAWRRKRKEEEHRITHAARPVTGARVHELTMLVVPSVFPMPVDRARTFRTGTTAGAPLQLTYGTNVRKECESVTELS